MNRPGLLLLALTAAGWVALLVTVVYAARLLR